MKATILGILIFYLLGVLHHKHNQHITSSQNQQRTINALTLELLHLQAEQAKQDSSLANRLQVIHKNMEKQQQLEHMIRRLGMNPHTGEPLGYDFPNPLLPTLNKPNAKLRDAGESGVEQR